MLLFSLISGSALVKASTGPDVPSLLCWDKKIVLKRWISVIISSKFTRWIRGTR